jgi:AcrR family transcriptional regulator
MISKTVTTTDTVKKAERRGARKDMRRDMRRRGDTLTESIYQAVEDIIKTEGYTNLTFQKIAQAARTSRTVLYRRWETPLELIHDIIVEKSLHALGGKFIDMLEDTGSLRGDLLRLLTLYQRYYIAVGPEIMNAMLFEMSQNSPAMVAIGQNAVKKNILATQKALDFARMRGERVKNVSEFALRLPFDLIRMQYLLHRTAIGARQVELLVDEILLPVFAETA